MVNNEYYLIGVLPCVEFLTNNLSQLLTPLQLVTPHLEFRPTAVHLHCKYRVMDELFDLTQHQLASFPVYLYWLQNLLQPEMFLSVGVEGSKILLCMAKPLKEGARRRSYSVFTEMYECSQKW